jgi:hypothetical protein
VNLLVTNVPRYIGHNVVTLAVQHLQIPDMAASNGPVDGACIVHRRMDELLTPAYLTYCTLMAAGHATGKSCNSLFIWQHIE